LVTWNDNIEKTCYTCQQVKPSSEFQSNPTAKDHLRASCKACTSVQKKSSYQRRHDQVREAQKRYYVRNRDKLLANLRVYNKKVSKTPKRKFKSYLQSAKARGYEFNLTFNDFMTFWQEDCTYCGAAIDTIGIDRVDSSQGYVMSNCVPCCSVCNMAKSNMTLDAFKSWAQSLNAHMMGCV
jgi:hypothetical protein